MPLLEPGEETEGGAARETDNVSRCGERKAHINGAVVHRQELCLLALVTVDVVNQEALVRSLQHELTHMIVPATD